MIKKGGRKNGSSRQYPENWATRSNVRCRIHHHSTNENKKGNHKTSRLCTHFLRIDHDSIHISPLEKTYLN